MANPQGMRLWCDPAPNQRYAPLVRLIDGVRQRRCSMCGDWLPLDEKHYQRHRRRPLGFHYVCKKCCNQRRKWKGS